MKANKFWKWKNQTETEERTLFLDGVISEVSWFDDDITPQMFKEELLSGSGNITVWINSPGGDCIAAAQIYNMLTDYAGNVTVKIDGIAASAASVIAMAGDSVQMSPVSMMMIHNPATIAMGDHNEMAKAIEMLNEVKESIMNAYAAKTGLSRAKLSRLMDEETWMNANKALQMGFCDMIMGRRTEEDEPDDEPDETPPDEPEEKPDKEEKEEEKTKANVRPLLFSRKKESDELVAKLTALADKPKGHSVDDVLERLETIKNFM